MKHIIILLFLTLSFKSFANEKIMICNNNNIAYKLSEKKLYVRIKGKWVEDCKPRNDLYFYGKNSDGSKYFNLEINNDSAICHRKKHTVFYRNKDLIGIKAENKTIIDFLLFNITYENVLHSNNVQTKSYQCKNLK